MIRTKCSFIDRTWCKCIKFLYYNEDLNNYENIIDIESKVVNIIDEDCQKYSINRETADKIVLAIRTFANKMHNPKNNGTLLDVKKIFQLRQ